MARIALIALAALALAANVSVAAAQEAAPCLDLIGAEAQARLDADPTYATRGQLDADGDGVACNQDACADPPGAQARLDADPTYATRAELDPDGNGVACEDPCADLLGAEAQARLDADPTYATRGQLDADGDGVACNDGVVGTLSTLPATGVGVALAASSTGGSVAMLLPLAALSAAASLAIQWRGRASRGARPSAGR